MIEAVNNVLRFLSTFWIMKYYFVFPRLETPLLEQVFYFFWVLLELRLSFAFTVYSFNMYAKRAGWDTLFHDMLTIVIEFFYSLVSINLDS